MDSKGSKTPEKLVKNKQSSVFVSIMAMDEDEFDPDEEKQEEDIRFSSFSQLKNSPVHICIFLQFVMTYYKQPYTFLFWLSTSSIKLSGPKEYRKWGEEIYNTFLSFNSPCYVMLPLDIDTEILESSKNKIYIEYNNPQIFDKMRAAVESELETMLADFRNKRSIGMIPFSITIESKDLCTTEGGVKKSCQILSQFVEKYASNNLGSLCKQDFDKANCLVYAIKHYLESLGVSSQESDDLLSPLIDPISGFKEKRNRSRCSKKESVSAENLSIGRAESMNRIKKPQQNAPDVESVGSSVSSADNETRLNKGSLHKNYKYSDFSDSTSKIHSAKKKNRKETLFSFGETAGDLFDENDPNFFSNLDLLSSDGSNWSETVSKDMRSKLKKAEIDRQEGIYELISTEKSYVKYLTILHKIYMTKMVDEDMISHVHSNFLFCFLPEILEFHLEFLRKLLALKSESLIIKSVSHILIEQFDGSKGELIKKYYAAFCSLQNIGIEALREKRKFDSKLGHFFRIAESLNMCNRLSFYEMHACLYQRITKYPLLFETIRKKTPSDHPDYFGINKALEFSKSLLTHANKVTHAVENLQKLNLIAKQIVWKAEVSGSPIEPEATFDVLRFSYIKDGTFTWNKGKSMCDVSIILLDKCVCIFVKKNDKLYPIESCFTVGSKISMLSYDHMIVRENAADDKGFFLLIDSLNYQVAPVIYQLVASSKHERKTWVEFIQGIVDSYKNKNLEKEMIDLSFMDKLGKIDEISSLKPSDCNEDDKDLPSHRLLRRISLLKSQRYLALDSSKTPTSKFMSKQIFFPD